MSVKKILVSQPRPQSERSPYFDIEKQFGLQIDFHQLIQVVGLNAREFRAQHINLLDYTAFIFSSRTGIDHFFRLCEEMRLTIPEDKHYYCSSESVGNYLQKYIAYRKRRVFFGTNNKFEDVVPAMLRRPDEKYLMICSDVHNDDTVKMFASHNISVDTCIMYKTQPVKITAKELKQYDMAVLFTPTGVHALKHNCYDYCSAGRIIATFGASTAVAAKEIGWEPAIVAPSKQFTSITAAIEHYLKQEQNATTKAPAKSAAKVPAKTPAKTPAKAPSKSAAKAPAKTPANKSAIKQ